jgi:cell division protein FtsW
MLRSSQIIMLCVVALLGLALVMVHSAGMTVSTTHHGTLAIFTSRNAAFAAAAIAAMLLAWRINIREAYRAHGWFNPLAWALFIAVLLQFLTLVPHVGKEVNGARRWLAIGPVTFQPSELVKWVMVLAVAWWCARRSGIIHRFWHGLVPIGVLIAAGCGLIIKEDLGTAALIGMVSLAMLIAGGARLWQLALVIPPAFVALVAAIAYSPYRRDRLLAFSDPWADPRGIGYHPIQSMVAVAQGGPTGMGVGYGIQKFGYLPEDTTDFIFAIICEEMGMAGAMLVVGLYLAILWTGLGIVRDCKDTFGRLVGLGVLLTVGLQATINIAVVTVVVPTKGIALPLISSGGTGWIVTAFMLGLVASLDEANRLEPHINRVERPEPVRRTLPQEEPAV